MLTFTKYCDEGEFSGLVYKIRYDENRTRVTYIKALSGTLKVREEVLIGSCKHDTYEKVSQIRFYNGTKLKTSDKVYAGEVFEVTGLTSATAGFGIGALKEKVNYEVVPTLKAKVIFDKAVIKGRGPVATFMNYIIEFTAFTKGKGKINFVFDGYDICHNSEEVIEKISYDKNADVDYTSTSMFCSKGQGFLVSWKEAESYMHCLK